MAGRRARSASTLGSRNRRTTHGGTGSGWRSLAAMGRQGVYVVSRPLRYRNQTVRLPDGTEHTVLVGEEKGIDVVDLRRTVDRDEPGDRPPGRIASWTIVTAGGVHDLAR